MSHILFCLWTLSCHCDNGSFSCGSGRVKSGHYTPHHTTNHTTTLETRRHARPHHNTTKHALLHATIQHASLHTTPHSTTGHTTTHATTRQTTTPCDNIHATIHNSMPFHSITQHAPLHTWLHMRPQQNTDGFLIWPTTLSRSVDRASTSSAGSQPGSTKDFQN